MPVYPVMLATPTSKEDPQQLISRLSRSGEWTFEFKWDGLRAQVHVRDGQVTIINRNGRDITFKFPDIVASFTHFGVDVVIDGEIVVLVEGGRCDFAGAHLRNAQESLSAIRRLAVSRPVTFIPFDLLVDGNVDLRQAPYLDRRARLVAHTPDLATGKVVLPPVSTDGLPLWAVAADRGLEGLIGKRNASPYVDGRSPAWVKIKLRYSLSALVCGWEPGEGWRRSTFGSLHLALVDPDGALVRVGKVGSGFSDADIRTIWERLQRGEQLVVEVEYLEVSPGGQLRDPVFHGLRTDVELTDATTTQMKP